MELQTSWLARDITAPSVYFYMPMGAKGPASQLIACSICGVLFTVDAVGVRTVTCVHVLLIVVQNTYMCVTHCNVCVYCT